MLNLEPELWFSLSTGCKDTEILKKVEALRGVFKNKKAPKLGKSSQQGAGGSLKIQKVPKLQLGKVQKCLRAAYA